MYATDTLKWVVASAVLAGGVAAVGGCYRSPGMLWCPGDYVWPGLRATGWDLNVCPVYHEQCPPGHYGGCPDNIVEGPAPPPPPIFRTREECERALGFIRAFAP